MCAFSALDYPQYQQQIRWNKLRLITLHALVWNLAFLSFHNLILPLAICIWTFCIRSIIFDLCFNYSKIFTSFHEISEHFGISNQFFHRFWNFRFLLKTQQKPKNSHSIQFLRFFLTTQTTQTLLRFFYCLKFDGRYVFGKNSHTCFSCQHKRRIGKRFVDSEAANNMLRRQKFIDWTDDNEFF